MLLLVIHLNNLFMFLNLNDRQEIVGKCSSISTEVKPLPVYKSNSVSVPYYLPLNQETIRLHADGDNCILVNYC